MLLICLFIATSVFWQNEDNMSKNNSNGFFLGCYLYGDILSK